MRVDISLLHDLNKEKLVTLVNHPSGELILANYTPICQYKRAWDEHPILLDCRGLIFNHEGEVIAKPFKKFFNLGEPGCRYEDFVDDVPEISTKLDGSLAISFSFRGELSLATRGAFESSQAIWATRYLRTNYAQKDFSPHYTYLFEIIYPDNRIVLDYGQEESLTLIGLVRLSDGQEMSYQEVKNEALRLEIPSTELLSDKSWEDLAKEERDNFEGYVLNFPKSGRKVKVKLRQYIELHKLVTDLTNKRIWEAAMNPDILEKMLDIAPDEVYGWVESTLEDFKKQAQKLTEEVEMAAVNARAISDLRKEQALWIMKNHQNISGLIFSYLDGKDISKQIWAAIEPTEKVSLPLKGSQVSDTPQNEL